MTINSVICDFTICLNPSKDAPWTRRESPMVQNSEMQPHNQPRLFMPFLYQRLKGIKIKGDLEFCGWVIFFVCVACGDFLPVACEVWGQRSARRDFGVEESCILHRAHKGLSVTSSCICIARCASLSNSLKKLKNGQRKVPPCCSAHFTLRALGTFTCKSKRGTCEEAGSAPFLSLPLSLLQFAFLESKDFRPRHEFFAPWKLLFHFL